MFYPSMLYLPPLVYSNFTGFLVFAAKGSAKGFLEILLTCNLYAVSMLFVAFESNSSCKVNYAADVNVSLVFNQNLCDHSLCILELCA